MEKLINFLQYINISILNINKIAKSKIFTYSFYYVHLFCKYPHSIKLVLIKIFNIFIAAETIVLDKKLIAYLIKYIYILKNVNIIEEDIFQISTNSIPSIRFSVFWKQILLKDLYFDKMDYNRTFFCLMFISCIKCCSWWILLSLLLIKNIDFI